MVAALAEAMVVLMALNQIAEMFTSSYFPGDSKTRIRKSFLFFLNINISPIRGRKYSIILNCDIRIQYISALGLL